MGARPFGNGAHRALLQCPDITEHRHALAFGFGTFGGLGTRLYPVAASAWAGVVVGRASTGVAGRPARLQHRSAGCRSPRTARAALWFRNGGCGHLSAMRRAAGSDAQYL